MSSKKKRGGGVETASSDTTTRNASSSTGAAASGGNSGGRGGGGGNERGGGATRGRGGAGGVRRGAGNARMVSGRGEIKVGGIMIKEWQRTPVQLLHEYTQNEKRPKPRFDVVRAEEPGKKKFRVVLQDPKKPGSDKDLLFTPRESFDDTNEAKHSVALLALSYVRKDMPLEKKLPDPYRQMWLDLIGDGSSSSSTQKAKESASSSNANGGDTSSRPPPAPTTTTSPETPSNSATVSENAGSNINGGNTPGNVAQSSPAAAAPPPATTTVKKRAGGGKNKNKGNKVSSQFKHASKAEADQAAQQSQQRRKEIEKKKRNHEAFLYANEDPALTMSEEIRTLAESSLQRLQDETHIDFGLMESHHATRRDDAQVLSSELLTYRDSLVKAGFSSNDATNALAQLSQKKDFPKYSNDKVFKEAFNWLCLNVPAHRLPPDLQPSAGQISISRPSTSTGDEALDSSVSAVSAMGFRPTDARRALNVCGGNKWSAIALLFANVRKVAGLPVDLSTDNGEEVLSEGTGLDEEVEALHSIFSDESFCCENFYAHLEPMALDDSPLEGDWKNLTIDVSIKHVRIQLNENKLFDGLPVSLNVAYVDVDANTKTALRGSVWEALAPINYPVSVPWVWVECAQSPQTQRFLMLCSLCKTAKQWKGHPSIFQLVTLLQDGLSIDSVSLECGIDPTTVDESLMKDPAVDKLLDDCTVALPSTNTSREPSTNHSRGSTTKSASEEWKRARSEFLYSCYKQSNLSDKFKLMMRVRQKLPIAKYQNSIAEIIRNNSIVLLSGETGSGKTTQVPQYILEDAVDKGQGGNTRILCTQPRRIAAISVANRVADERCERLGPVRGSSSTDMSNVVGYHIRGEKRCDSNTHLVFCTTGILLKQLQSGLPDGVSHIVVDEVHERNVDTDFLLAVLRGLVRKNPDLRVILMSATMNAQTFADYFSKKSKSESIPPGQYSKECQKLISDRVVVPGAVPQIFIPGFIHPVKELYVDDVVEEFGMLKSLPTDVLEKRKGEYTNQISPYAWLKMGISYEVVVHILDVVVSGDGFAPPGISQADEGAILVFLPGIAEIKKVERMLYSKPSAANAFIVPLHGSLSSSQQSFAFKRPPKGKRKVVLATNIAETSVTIDDITVVIDCGREKAVNFDPASRLHRLTEDWISRAGANQRKGRAGRAQPGVCYRVWPSTAHNILQEYAVPEIKRISLENLVLQVKALHLGNAYNVLKNVLDAPAPRRICTALQQLEEVGAIDFETPECNQPDEAIDRSKLTNLGRYLANLPMDARLGKILLYGYMLGCSDSACCIVASLSTRSPLQPIKSQGDSDDDSGAGGARKEFIWNTSDHLTAISMYKAWDNMRDRNRKRQFCRDMRLSEETLDSMKSLIQDFGASMRELGFARANHSEKDANIISAIIAGGLYPNVARIVRPKRQYEKGAHGASRKAYDPKDIKFYTLERTSPEEALGEKEDKTDIARPQTYWAGWPVRRVFIHPSSMLFNCGEFQYPWLVYHTQVETSKSFIRDATMVSPFALALFGGHLDVDHTNGILAVGSDLQVKQQQSTKNKALAWIEFRASGRVAAIVQALRKALDTLLHVKLDNPDFDISNHIIQKTITTLIRGEGW